MFRFCTLCLAAASFLFVASLRASAQATAAGLGGGKMQVGATYSNSQSDEYLPRTQGASAYATFDFTEHLGLEAAIHLPALQAPDGWVEKSYLAGVRYVHKVGRFEPYAKVLAGFGQVSVQHTYMQMPGVPGTYSAFAVAAGLDIRLAHKLNIRALDYEYQEWPSFPSHSLTPTIVSVGAAFRFR